MDASKKWVGERIVTIGGTFDELHRGHKEYIRLAFEFATRVIIYVNSNQFNSDQFTNGKKKYLAHPYAHRLEKLREFLQEIEQEMEEENALHRKYCQIKELNHVDDVKKDYLENPELQEVYMAIVSPEYYHSFVELNRARAARGLPSFLILVKHRTRDLQQDISSTLIREVLHCPTADHIPPASETAAQEEILYF